MKNDFLLVNYKRKYKNCPSCEIVKHYVMYYATQLKSRLNKSLLFLINFCEKNYFTLTAGPIVEHTLIAVTSCPLCASVLHEFTASMND